MTCSSLKPTQWSYPGGGINQIPGEATLCGDIRVTPFYRRAAPPPLPRTKWTRCVLLPVLIGHAASLTPFYRRAALHHSYRPHVPNTSLESVHPSLESVHPSLESVHPSLESVHPSLESVHSPRTPAGLYLPPPGPPHGRGLTRAARARSAEKVAAAVKGYVDDINADVTKLPSRGPISKYALDDGLKGPPPRPARPPLRSTALAGVGAARAHAAASQGCVCGGRLAGIHGRPPPPSY